MKDSGHEKEIAEYGRTKFEKRWSGSRRERPSRKKGEGAEQLEYRERVRSGLKTALAYITDCGDRPYKDKVKSACVAPLDLWELW